MAHSLGDPSVSQALVYETTHRTAADVLFHETDPRGDSRRPAGPWVFVIVIRGHFLCAGCTGPPGHKPPRGRVAYTVWSPYRGTMDFGLTAQLPKFLDRLGRPVRVAARAT